MTNKHTQGPWHIDTGLYGDKDHISIWGDKDFNGCCELVTEISNTPNPDTDREANAHLIAAAPELLEALESLLKHVPLKWLNVKKDFSLLLAHATATKAIAKAKGE